MENPAVTVIEGTWEEITQRAGEFAGRRLRVTLLDSVQVDEESIHSARKRRAEAFREWAESHPRTAPPLSDEAISRESIYGETV